MPDDHSKVEPPLPIPNRTVKRLCADDSEQLACESRLSSGSYAKAPTHRLGLFSFADVKAGANSGISRLVKA